MLHMIINTNNNNKKKLSIFVQYFLLNLFVIAVLGNLAEKGCCLEDKNSFILGFLHKPEHWGIQFPCQLFETPAQGTRVSLKPSHFLIKFQVFLFPILRFYLFSNNSIKHACLSLGKCLLFLYQCRNST